MISTNQIPTNPTNLRTEWAGCARRLDFAISPADALEKIRSLGKSILFQSSKLDSKLGRFSFLMADPFAWIELDTLSEEPECEKQIPFITLRNALKKYTEAEQPNLPPFQGGAAGFLSYDLSRYLEKLPPAQLYDFPVPALAFGLYDTVIAWDHSANESWIISQGFPETEFSARQFRADQRSTMFLDALCSDAKTNDDFKNLQIIENICSPYACDGLADLTSNFSRSSYDEMIEKAIGYIYAGDIYQVNLAQRLLVPSTCDSLELYRRLCKVNAAPFAGWLDLGDTQIVSCSPERLVRVNDRRVETRPIKGTRRRTRFPQVDLTTKAELESSVKDRAENVMIVDLMRNDLSRVCKDHSVVVNQLLETEAYESVLHLVSSVEGELLDEVDCIDLLEAIFPGGSITGAPKIRAMEIIAELEPTSRGAYCGSLGYIGFDGSMDFNILIRTITASKGFWQIPVGGGIVAQSKAQDEYDETWTKAASMLHAIKGLAK